MNSAPVVTTLAAVLPIHGPPRPATSAANSGRKTIRISGCISWSAPRRRPGSRPNEKNGAAAPPGPRPSPGNMASSPSPSHPVDVVDRDRAAAAEEDDEDG